MMGAASRGGAWSPTRVGRVARAAWIGATAPHRLSEEVGHGSWWGWAVGGLVSAVAALATALLVPGSLPVTLGVVLLLIVYAAALATSWNRSRSGRAGRGLAPAALGPLLVASLLMLAVIGVRGPDYFWLLFWTEDHFRTLLFGAVLAVALWTLLASYRAGVVLGGRRTFAAGSVLLATGFMLFVLVVVLPDLQGTLAALDDPLHLLPMRRALINGVTHYAGVSDLAMRVPGAIGGAMMLLGAGLTRIGAAETPRPSFRR